MQLTRAGSAPLNVLTNYSLLAGEVSTGLVNKAVLRTWLDGLPNNSTITVTCKVTFDGSSVESTAITFPTATYTVITSLRIDQSQMNLNGTRVLTNWPATGRDWAGNTQTRVASGGVGSYSYASSAPTIASVHLTTGKVTGNRNGTATITARDRNNISRSYTVVVSNIFQLQVNETHQSPTAAINWMNSIGGRPLVIGNSGNGSIISALSSIYNPPPRLREYGLCSFNGDWYNCHAPR